MKRGLAALERKAAKEAKKAQSTRVPASGLRTSSETSGLERIAVLPGKPSSGQLSSQCGQPLSKALALQLQLGTQGTDTASLENFIRSLLQTNSTYSSQLESATGEKLQDKSISLLPSRHSNAKPVKRHINVLRSHKAAARWIQELRQDIIDNPSKGVKISQTLESAWQAYATEVARQGSAGRWATSPTLSLLGAPVSVAAARDPRLVGIRGVCLWDTSCNIHVLVSKGAGASAGLASLPRRTTALSFELPDVLAARVGQKYMHQIGDLCAQAVVGIGTAGA